MAQVETAFDALRKLADDLDIGFFSGPLQPPEAGRLFLNDRSLADLLLPAWGERLVAIGIVPGGPGVERESDGTALLTAESAAQLVAAVEAAGGHVYQGRLARLMPADWVRRHGGQPAPNDAPYDLPGPGTPIGNPITAHIASLDTGPLMDAARAAGWPATFANEPVLFLDDEPLYHLLMRENIGRVVTLVVAALEMRGSSQ
jgi:hypothetical protein